MNGSDWILIVVRMSVTILGIDVLGNSAMISVWDDWVGTIWDLMKVD